MIAWVCTVMFVPAYIMMISEKSLENFGHGAVHEEKPNQLTKLLNKTGGLTFSKAKPILLGVIIITIIAFYGITRIQINDNPVKWFSKKHPIRQADIVLNEHFGGTYMAYLVLEDGTDGKVSVDFVGPLRDRWLVKGAELTKETVKGQDLIVEMEKLILSRASGDKSREEYIDSLIEITNKKLESAEASGQEAAVDLWYEILEFFEMEREGLKLFKQPVVLEYVAKLQGYLAKVGLLERAIRLPM